jgi:hypothetical protein
MKFKEFDIEIPEVLDRLGFADDSWHNDSAARATLKLPNGSVLVAWVAEFYPKDREFPEGPRFGLQIMVDEDSYGDPRRTVTVGDYDDEEEFSRVVEKLVSCFR